MSANIRGMFGGVAAALTGGLDRGAIAGPVGIAKLSYDAARKGGMTLDSLLVALSTRSARPISCRCRR